MDRAMGTHLLAGVIWCSIFTAPESFIIDKYRRPTPERDVQKHAQNSYQEMRGGQWITDTLFSVIFNAKSIRDSYILLTLTFSFFFSNLAFFTQYHCATKCDLFFSCPENQTNLIDLFFTLIQNPLTNSSLDYRDFHQWPLKRRKNFNFVFF